MNIEELREKLEEALFEDKEEEISSILDEYGKNNFLFPSDLFCKYEEIIEDDKIVLYILKEGEKKKIIDEILELKNDIKKIQKDNKISSKDFIICKLTEKIENLKILLKHK